jgi:hypothetical protein
VGLVQLQGCVLCLQLCKLGGQGSLHSCLMPAGCGGMLTTGLMLASWSLAL